MNIKFTSNWNIGTSPVHERNVQSFLAALLLWNDEEPAQSRPAQLNGFIKNLASYADILWACHAIFLPHVGGGRLRDELKECLRRRLSKTMLTEKFV